MQLPEKKGSSSANGADPREVMSAEVIDLASRNAFPVVTQRKGRSDMVGLMAGVGIVALLGVVTLWGMNAARVDSGQQAQPAAGTVQPLPVAPAVPSPDEMPAAPPQTVAPPVPAPDPGPAPVLSNMPGAQPGMAANPYSNPTVVFDASSLPVPIAAVTPATPAGSTVSSSAGDFASRVGGVGGGPAKAARQFDPQTTITQGTLIPAVLETAINTDVPGFVRAVVSQDVRSYDGTRVLLPRSSRLVGQYQSGLQAGQKRAYVIWTRAIRPDGITVDLASPGTDFAGMTGLPGDVNTHFFKRFGSAMLLSVIGGLGAFTSGGTAVVLGGGQSAAATALQQDGQIAPTVRVRQGEPIRVFTARDLDFSTAPTL
ncbi:TrbI/VirB10 family protein [Altererythrobacter sp. CC-YST694]|uniref:TrbI/VirB10 family protein n=1 Tax=Altererythrobacter sp. CC-YST694 TaxID=2755038 RepID=UPI001D01951E|nr:TrbI/VirB10 family protein [Altererythrobacter sp. CC-YST694]MCB5426023.1 TrbI/VirB10 family protein [Altererythrobacter sp. CC-YST694]